jgi:hypothetical protein
MAVSPIWRLTFGYSDKCRFKLYVLNSCAFPFDERGKWPLVEQLYDKSYKFPYVESLSQVLTWTQILWKEYFHQY